MATKKAVKKAVKKSVKRDKAKSEWAKANRGLLTKIAKAVKPPVTPVMVHYVLHGDKSTKDGRVEKALKKAGAPIKAA